jgi:hypothetical protein
MQNGNGKAQGQRRAVDIERGILHFAFCLLNFAFELRQAPL